MDGEMYGHPATRANVARLRDAFGYRIIEPEAGLLASGQVGVGRLASLGAIVDAVAGAIADRPVRAPDEAVRPPRSPAPPREADLTARHLVVTAGGTAEPIDPVRYIGNRSSGRMGVAVADAALDRGAQVTLVVGRTEVPLPDRAVIVHAETTDEMERAVMDALERGFDALVMAAAVADFRPRAAADRKLAREAGLTIELEPTTDILASVGARVAGSSEPAGRPVLVGFAAETGSLARAAGKLERKNVDFLVANDVAEEGSGFGTNTNRVTIYRRDAEPIELPLLPKREVADRLLDLVAGALDERDAAAHTSRVEARP
jgi:phosphopantothenoylcysteine decarboxylase/phosphopantothenate--cysteine ligase